MRKRIALSVLAPLLLLGGCATPGPLHVYTAAPGAPEKIIDRGETEPAAEVPSYLKQGDTLVGFAYDPFTDHFFLRFAPGDRFRVVDRPARAIKREFTVASLANPRGGDLAIRPRDGHVFAAHPAQPAVIEFNRFGDVVRTLPLATLNAPPAALAFDLARDHLLALSGGDLARITVHDLSGQRLSAVALDRDVTLTVLAYDSDKREYYTPLAREPAIGIFDDSGHLLRTLPLTTPTGSTFLDVGPRSFLRLF
ncbi:MAG: hypothetical protein NTV51_09675 [Verrucomicrobia bacterium]|nr:hypothetical protein [Verrucomicrobiota bacterium]